MQKAMVTDEVEFSVLRYLDEHQCTSLSENTLMMTRALVPHGVLTVLAAIERLKAKNLVRCTFDQEHIMPTINCPPEMITKMDDHEHDDPIEDLLYDRILQLLLLSRTKLRGLTIEDISSELYPRFANLEISNALEEMLRRGRVSIRKHVYYGIC
jgi:hypothetical protein